VSDWKIGLTPATTKGAPVILGPLTALMAWKRLSKPAREAVEAAYPDGAVKCHSLTRDSLTRHGFAAWDNAAQDWLLTDAGKAVAKWNMPR
jgi:hypothetical protein